MSASFTINLDTKSPIISIFAPTYTTLHASAEITIQANETLANIQNIFIIDSAGTRVGFTFNYLVDKYVGTIDFSSLQIGMATIYAILKDEVLNGAFTSKSISITDSSYLFLTISESVNDLILNESIRNTLITNETIIDMQLSEVEQV